MTKNTYGTGSFVLMNVGDTIAGTRRRTADHRRLGTGRRVGGVHARRRDLRDRRGDPVVARRARHDRSARRRSAHWPRASTTPTACSSCPRSPVSVAVVGPYARGAIVGITRGTTRAAHRPRRGGVDGAVDPRRGRRHDGRQRPGRHRAARRRRRVGDEPVVPDAGRPAPGRGVATRRSPRPPRWAPPTSPVSPKACGRRLDELTDLWSLDAAWRPQVTKEAADAPARPMAQRGRLARAGWATEAVQLMMRASATN